jgi:hypothetical protein
VVRVRAAAGRGAAAAARESDSLRCQRRMAVCSSWLASSSFLAWSSPASLMPPRLSMLCGEERVLAPCEMLCALGEERSFVRAVGDTAAGAGDMDRVARRSLAACASARDTSAYEVHTKRLPP